MRFVFPNKEYEQKAIEFIQEFRDYDSPINGTGGLDRFLENATYQDWLLKIEADRDIANIPEDRVPAYTYFYVREDDDKIIGIINIRLALNDFLRKEGGHIGYCIRPTERRKGYGTRMLKEALEFLKPIGLTNIIITCGKENLASAGVIKNCGGVLEAEFYSDVFNQVIQRYRIRLE
ncbi:MAG TPA: GNAT family N-acetyltransferase [Clostridiaceae bacterium]|nr:GNAT family N-acetyltransferase [Clostridiaceae bacterium]